ncbi:MAG: STAS domain-containing protein [Methylotenera sp.]|uniref:STAS domain-containing protein n=1 Tax=Methylotenera sp. TaxID=2051956 RepID=UPI0024872898|nr:STAS domain-containing protein [Methylotenera sp.]MDI1309163.1 STAS domain-containing protein [Methylotenera sp.]
MSELVQLKDAERITAHGNKWQVFGDLLVYNATLVLNQSATFKMSGEIEVDFSAVDNVDTSTLSLMLEWQRRAVAEDCKIKFTHLPESLASLADLYGIEDFIPLSFH